MEPDPYDDGPGKPVGDMQFVSAPCALALTLAALLRVSQQPAAGCLHCTAFAVGS